ncbi:Hypothetical protein TAM4_268 [Thermococcus sp. AM4]|nr:Hypothetical protein TAM4_268 [Thermococcus sp. AM4]
MGLFWAIIFYFYLMAILIVPLISNIGILWLLSRMTVKKVLGFEIGDGIERELAIFFLILFISSGIRWYLFKVAINSIVNTSRFWLLSLPTVVLIGAVEIMGARAFGWYRNIESTKKIALIVAPLYISIALSIGVSLVWGMMADGV